MNITAAFGRRFAVGVSLQNQAFAKFLLHSSEIVAIMHGNHLESACPQPSIPPPYSPAPARLLV
jgi:hypothetical protein